ncbi:M3 family oligoendopeptidase [uncultured Cetobacterium sp.]|uniref:M3 family oligoendopeptidase n=1 Tax=uncultured Cetobacterium sp. TaxID=527638 RepID=UPI00262F780C|nr:M3 family oligoendopeptidase [uncultured Cetobacterium sp.]
MQFSEYKYERPNFNETKIEFEKLLNKITTSNYKEQLNIIKEINTIRNKIDTMSNLAHIRHTIDTNDDFYDKEKNHWDEISPLYQELDTLFYKELLKSKFLDQLKIELGIQFFSLIEYSLKAFSPEIIENLQEENKEISKYVKLLASAKISFQGEERNLSGMTPFLESSDRRVRKSAYEAKSNFFTTYEKDFDEIYDNLVKIRTKIANKLGYDNYVELGYIRMNRVDYNDKMVDNFRKQVVKEIVPIASSLYVRQKERLNLTTLNYYDERFEFESGNPTPKGTPQWIIDQGKKMYHEMSQETAEFIDYMINNDLMDLTTKKGKAGGGYCTFIPDYKSPFIFSNFNGTSGDVDVLTHEAGHAFQVFRSKHIEIPELLWATYESSEIHSMSMEFFAWDWMENFFKEDKDKYFYSHLGGAIKFIPYGVLVDHFQHEVYKNPNLTPNERKTIWRELEKQYKPHTIYDENEFLENGGWWFQQSHIFEVPFYYIDYTLAQICALQFWKKMIHNREGAWKDYLHLCSLGGTKSFLGLLEEANLISPFKDNCIKNITEDVKNFLSSIDDKKL